MRPEHWLYTLPLNGARSCSRRQVERDLDDEIRYHLEQQVDELVSKGMDRDEAWRLVGRHFGAV